MIFADSSIVERLYKKRKLYSQQINLLWVELFIVVTVILRTDRTKWLPNKNEY